MADGQRRPQSRSVRIRTSLTAALGLAAAACASEVASDPSFRTIDSAGVRLVENGGDVWSVPSSRSLSAEPVVRIGAVDGDPVYLFDQIRAVVALVDGRIVVANAGTNTVRWFDPAGRFLFERGGEGDGPGEFRRLAGVTLARADTIVAMDSRAYRVTSFSADGELLSVTRIEGLPGPPGAAYRLTDGSHVVGTTGFSSQQLGSAEGSPELLGHHRFPTPILRVHGEPAVVDTIGLFPGMEMHFRVLPDGRSAFGPHGYGRNLHYGVHADEIYVGSAERFEVHVFAADGRLVRSVRAPEVDLGLVAEDAVRTMRERLRAHPEYATASPEERAEAEADLVRDEAGLPAVRPAYAGLLVGSDGTLWLSEHDPDPAFRRRWALFGPDGRARGTVTLPERFTPLSVTSDLVLGRLQDELGVQYVAGYRLGP